MAKVSETVTENIFRSFYGADTFIEKSAIPSECGFTSKKGSGNDGYPDFFLDTAEYAIVVEAKATKHSLAKTETVYYMEHKDNIVNSDDTELLAYIRKCKPTKVIINPPYENNKSIKFALQAIEYLEKNGKLIIIMPTPTLTHNQGGLTEKLLNVAKLDFVIRMPEKLFSEQKRTVNTSIFGFTKTKHNQHDTVLFYNLSDDGFVSIQHKGRVDKTKSWPKKEDDVVNAIFAQSEIPGVCEKRPIYKNGILNCAGIRSKKDSTYEMVKIGTLFKYQWGSLASESSEDAEGWRQPLQWVWTAFPLRC